MVNLVKILEELKDYAYNVDLAAFQRAFGDTIGKHLWEKYKGFDFDLIRLFSNLDTSNRQRLAESIQERGDF